MSEERQIVTVTLFDSYNDENRWTVPDTLAWLQGLHDQIPEEHRENSTFLVELERGYYDEGATLTFKVSYDRPETDEEMRARLAQEEARRLAYEREAQARELATLAALKAKYEGSRT